MAISTNQKPTIYRNLYENIGPGRGEIWKNNDTTEIGQTRRVAKIPSSIFVGHLMLTVMTM